MSHHPPDTAYACCALLTLPQINSTQHVHSLTCPSVAVLLANVSAVLQQDPGAVQVAQRDSEVKRSTTARVQRL